MRLGLKGCGDSQTEVASHMFRLMAHFHRRVWVGKVCKGAARCGFPPPKVLDRAGLPVEMRHNGFCLTDLG